MSAAYWMKTANGLWHLHCGDSIIAELALLPSKMWGWTYAGQYGECHTLDVGMLIVGRKRRDPSISLGDDANHDR